MTKVGMPGLRRHNGKFIILGKPDGSEYAGYLGSGNCRPYLTPRRGGPVDINTGDTAFLPVYNDGWMETMRRYSVNLG